MAFYFLEQMTGIEPASSAWEAEVLPLNYICMSYLFIIINPKRIFKSFFADSGKDFFLSKHLSKTAGGHFKMLCTQGNYVTYYYIGV